MSLNSTYQGGVTPNIEGYDATGMQGFILNLIAGEATTPANVPPIAVIGVTWWADSTQTTILYQQLFEVNCWRNTVISGPVMGKYLTVGIAGTAIGVWTNVQFFAYPVPLDVYDAPTPYGRTWGTQAPWVPDTVPGDDGILVQKTSAGTAMAANAILTWYCPIMVGEIEVSCFCTSAGAVLSVYHGSLDRTTFTVPSSGTDGHFRLFVGRRAIRLTVSGATAGTVFLGANRHLPEAR